MLASWRDAGGGAASSGQRRAAQKSLQEILRLRRRQQVFGEWLSFYDLLFLSHFVENCFTLTKLYCQQNSLLQSRQTGKRRRISPFTHPHFGSRSRRAGRYLF